MHSISLLCKHQYKKCSKDMTYLIVNTMTVSHVCFHSADFWYKYRIELPKYQNTSECTQQNLDNLLQIVKCIMRKQSKFFLHIAKMMDKLFLTSATLLVSTKNFFLHSIQLFFFFIIYFFLYHISATGISFLKSYLFIFSL